MSRPKNTDVFRKWNNPMYRDDPFAPWNDPMKKDDVFACWNDTFGEGLYKDEVERYR